MILYPSIYVLCTAPLAIGRIAELAGHEVSLGYLCVTGTMIACNGWLDVLLYTSTRADIVFAEHPDSDDIGLDTFAFMGKGHPFGTTTTVEGGPPPTGAGLRTGPGGDSVENLCGLHNISVRGEVTISVDRAPQEILRQDRRLRRSWDGTSEESR